MSLHMRKPGARSHLPLVVETTVPSAVRVAGKAEVVLTVEQSGGTPSVVLIPCLRVTGD
jgi:2-phospho-L-lactate guanylyltransferase (CobY/MobA/RfbA family)